MSQYLTKLEEVAADREVCTRITTLKSFFMKGTLGRFNQICFHSRSTFSLMLIISTIIRSCTLYVNLGGKGGNWGCGE